MSQPSGLWSHIRRYLTHRHLWQAGGLLLSANLIVVALELLRVPIVTRLLSKEEVGMIAIVGSVLPFLHLLSLSGLDASAYHYIAKGQEGALRVCVGARLRWSLLSTLGFLVGGAYWLWQDNSLLAWLFTITALTYPLVHGLSVVSSALTAKEHFGRLFHYRVSQALARYAGLGVLLLLPAMDTQVIWYSLGNQFVLGALQVGTAVWLVSHFRVIGDGTLSTADRSEIIRYGRHLTAMNAISTVQTRVDAPLVAWLLPRTVMADFWVAQLVQAQFKRLWTMYYSLRYPPLVRLQVDFLRKRLIFEAAIAWVVFALAAVASVALLRVVLPVVLPDEYATSLPIVAWLLAAFVASVPGFFAETYFRMRQDERRLYVLRGVAAVGGIVFPVVAIFIWQLQGVVVARFVISLVLSTIGVILFQRDRPEEPSTGMDRS